MALPGNHQPRFLSSRGNYLMASFFNATVQGAQRKSRVAGLRFDTAKAGLFGRSYLLN
jgi:hypothetical protein